MRLVDYSDYLDEFIKNPYKINMDLLTDEGRMALAYNGNGCIPTDELPDNVDVIYCQHLGGTIVGFKDGITLVSFTSRDTPPMWEEKLTEYLKSKGLDARHEDNDVLVDGYKVSGGFSKWLNSDMQYYGIHISMNTDLDVIRKICTKPMEKIPKGLSEYGFTRSDILSALGVEDEE